MRWRCCLRAGSRRSLALAFLLLATAGPASGLASELPAFALVRGSFTGSDGRLLGREGELLQELRLRFEGRALRWVSLAETSYALREAVVAVEDRRFFSHGGVDFRAALGALWQNLRGGRRGASTISMQVAGMIDPTSLGRRGRRGFWEKARQARLAWELERHWAKEEILEAYLNLVTFRGEQRGLAAAARFLFGKEPHGLDIRESYLLAVLLRAPGMRAEAAGDLLCRYGATAPLLGDCPALRSFATTTLAEARSAPPRAAMAPHLARRLLSVGEPELRSSLSGPIQEAALAAVRDQLRALGSKNAQDAAVIVADNRSGEVLAYVGGSGELSAAPEVDMAQARRQAGSTLKPFLYALAFDRGYLRPGSWILDEPFEIGLDRGSYGPGNYDNRFHGPVPVAVALASSLNVPAVRLAELVGVEPFHALLQGLGFRALEEAAHYGPSLALGTADVTLFDLTQAYVALANEGLWRPLRFTPSGDVAANESGARRVLSRRSAREIAAVLSGRGYRALTFGWDSVLATPYAAAVKTGTSKDMRDNWCVGFSRDFTVAVWVGNGGGEPMWSVSGISGAAPIWRAMMDRLHQNRRIEPFAALARRDPPAFERGSFGRILYPVAGAVLALDPDIPEASQRVAFEAEGGHQLLLDGSPLADPVWKPVRGRHRLRLAARDGTVLDELSFEVR